MLKKIVSALIIYFVIISVASQVLAAEKNYDYSDPKFQAVVDMLYMDGHSNDSVTECSVKQMYYEKVAVMFFDKGMSKQEILDYYEKELGEQAINVPKAKGFNIMLWVTPFLLMLIVSSILYFVIKKWKRNRAIAFNNEENEAAKDIVDDFYVSLIEKERRKFL
jgi:cytochrome c-type biogenesis protein CcmH